MVRLTLTQWSGIVLLLVVAYGAWRQRHAVSAWLDRVADDVR